MVPELPIRYVCTYIDDVAVKHRSMDSAQRPTMPNRSKLQEKESHPGIIYAR
jgi:hypothetical protein